MIARDGLDMNLLIAMYGDPEGWSGISASGAGPAAECAARLALPQVRSSSEAAERGTALHEFARVITLNPNSRAQALLDMDEKWRATAEGIDIGEALTGLELGGCERAYALDVKTRKVRFIGENISRQYSETLKARLQKPLGRYEIPLSMDVEATYDGTPVELDYKSGQDIGAVEDHWQRRVCAAALMFFHGTPTAISRVGYIWNDGSIHHDGHEFTILDAEETCDELVKTIDAVWEARLLFANGIMPTVYPSEGTCAYCPALDSCPAKTNFAKAMLGRLQDISQGPEVSTLTNDEKAQLWKELKDAEKIVESTLATLKAMAKVEPIQLSDTHVIGPRHKARSYFDASKARGLLVTLMGQAGSSDEEITAALKSLNGITRYEEIAKQKIARDHSSN